MRGRNHLGEFGQVVLWAVLRLADQPDGVTARREIAPRTKREVSIGAIHAPSTMILGIFFAAPICSPLSLLFVPRAAQLAGGCPSYVISCEPVRQCDCYRPRSSHRQNVEVK